MTLNYTLNPQPVPHIDELGGSQLALFIRQHAPLALTFRVENTKLIVQGLGSEKNGLGLRLSVRSWVCDLGLGFGI